MPTSIPRQIRYLRQYNRRCFFSLFFIVLVSWIIMMRISEFDDTPALIYFDLNKPFVVNDHTCFITGDKWIVVTTSDYPTLAIQKFLSLTTSWNLVVIANQNTPKDWRSHVIDPHLRLYYISFEEQKHLNFHILKLLPPESYARKNLGYLLAIKCGAKVIYESDDNNFILPEDLHILPKVLPPEEVPYIAFRRQRSSFINIYGSFGHPQIWPRGFPIDEIRNVTEDGWHSVRRNTDNNTNVYIQHYLADPDLDAIYRSVHSIAIGQIEFDRDQPPIALQPFTFSPYTTQNTVTYYEAFWGLCLPATTTARVSDIWRGYWAQRLLWDIGGRLLFSTSTVKQSRINRSYIKDQTDEEQLYSQSSAFVRFLASWSSSHYTLTERIVQLAEDMVQADFWQLKEVTVLDAWLADLLSVGYIFPSIVRPVSTATSIKQKPVAVCVTGLVECVSEAWASTHNTIHRIINSEADAFLFLSSSSSTRGPVSLDTRLKQARLYMDSTVTILYEDRVIDPHIPSSCKIYYDPKINMALEINLFQQLWALSECFDLIEEYAKTMGVHYEFIIRSRADSDLRFIGETLPFPGNWTILIPDENHFFGYNDRFAIGSAPLMKRYMRRWHDISNCTVQNLHPESFLKGFLKRVGIVVQPVSGLTFTQQLHRKDRCH